MLLKLQLSTFNIKFSNSKAISFAVFKFANEDTR